MKEKRSWKVFILRHQALRKGSTDTQWKNSVMMKSQGYWEKFYSHSNNAWCKMHPTSEAQKNNNELQKFNPVYQ